MRRFLTSSLVWAGILVSFAALGQEVPVGLMPMQFNPGFAGEAGSPRLSTAFGMVPPTADRSSHSINASYDAFLPAIRSGIGVSVGQYGGMSRSFFVVLEDYWKSRGYNFAVAVAPKFSFKGKYTFSPSVDIRHQGGDLAYRFNWAGSSVISSGRMRSQSWSGRAALLLNGPKWYAGYSVDVPLSNDIVFDPDSVGIFNGGIPDSRFNSYWQFGYTFQRTAESKFSFTPQLVFRTGYAPEFIRYRVFRYFRLQSVNLTFRHGKILWGLTNAGLHAGYQTERLRVLLCNGMVGSSGRNYSYSGLLSLRYVFKKAD